MCFNKKILLLISFSFSLITCFSQNATIDSLFVVLKTAKEDTNKVNILNSLSDQLWRINEYEQAKKHADDALTLSEKLNFKKGKAIAFNNIGNIYNDQGNYAEALKDHFASLEIDKEIGNKKGIATSYNNIGSIYYYQGNYPEALKIFFIALKIKEEIDDKKGIASAYSNIGVIYANQGNYPEALKNYFLSLKTREEIGDKKGIADSYNNIGNIYYYQSNYSVALKNYFSSLKIREEIGDKGGIAASYNNMGAIYDDQGNYPEALKNYFASLKIVEEIGSKKGIATSYNNIGAVYEHQGNYPESLKNYFASLKIKEEIGDKNGIVWSYINLGTINIKLNKLADAKMYLNNALTLSIQIGNKERIKDCYSGLSTLDSTQGNWKDAYEHHKLFILYRDSIDNEETKKKTIQTSLTYQFEKKEAEVKAAQDKKDDVAAIEMKKQQIIRYAVSGILVLVVLFTLFLYNRFRLIRQQKNIIELKENETQQQKEVIEEKHKEITDSINYAERIQRSLLASEDLLNANLKEHFVFFQPKAIVSGDFYWASKLSNHQFALITADSTGHGVPGAIMSILNIACLNEAIKEGVCAPDEILNHTRKKIIDVLKRDGSEEGGKDGMDCSLISFDFKNNKFTYSAANNPVWIVRENKIMEFKPDNMPIGKHERDAIPFTQHTIELQKNDMLYTLTDGMADQFGGPKGKKFMYKQLKELLISIAHLSMNEQKEKLTNVLNDWKGNLEQVDDICIIGVRV